MKIKKIIREELNDFEWVRDVEPELTPETLELIYNKPFHFYPREGGEPNMKNGVPTVYWVDKKLSELKNTNKSSESPITDNREFFLCYKEPQGPHITHQCSEMYAKTIISYIKRKQLVQQKELSDIKESEIYLNKIVSRLSLIKEDGKKPDMEWDFTKTNLDKSKRWVKTKEDVKKYLLLLFDKLKNLPRKTKIKIIKYVLTSFIGLLTISQLQDIVDETSPEKIEIKKPVKQEPSTDKDSNKVMDTQINKIRKPSEELITFLKKEEGYVGKGYKIGDGKITIGWGHAEDINDSKYALGQEIDTTEAEILLKQDVKESSDALNRILNTWESKGINIDVTQDMYNVMTSMIFNMGIGNFRKSDFIQLVKKNKLDKAKERIKTTSSHLFSEFPGLKKRRKLESELFN
jgi:lysozyme